MAGTDGGTLVLIPAHDEAATIGRVLEAVARHVHDADVLVVNDGSRDATGAIVAAARVPQLVLPCNLGYGRAVQTGLRYGVRRGYATVVMLDADGQHEPAEIPRLLEAMRRGADVVIGSRFVEARRYSGPPARRPGMRLFSVLTWLLIGQRVYDTTSGFKALTRAAYEPLAFGNFLDFHAESLVFWGRSGFRIEEVPVAVAPRTSGRSMYSPLASATYPLKTLMLMLVGLMDARAYRSVR